MEDATLERALSAPSPQPWSGITEPTARGRSRRRIGDVIVDLGFADREVVEAAVSAARSSGQTTGKVLLDSGVITHDQLARAVAERYGLDHFDLGIFKVDMAAANLITPTAAKRYQAVPVGFADSRTLMVAMADPANVLAIDDIAMMTGHEVRPAIASHEDIAELITRLSRLDDAVAEEELGEPETGPEDTEVAVTAEEAPIIKLVHSVIAEAIEQGASDIHFDPDPQEMRVRFRIDGVVSDSTRIPRRMIPGVISRIKLMASLDISERRLPQDGRVGLVVDGRRVDVRVATLPIVRGESVVMRILDKDSVVMDLDELGMSHRDRQRFESAIGGAHGAALVTGPTGSGKSTTLYAALSTLNRPDRTIITIEDPVEYELPGIKQVQVNLKAGLTFANGLRSMIRSDPDIIMVGEIRDRETAQTAVESALTGHLVLSTLHTNDAPAALTRLGEMDVEPFLVASAIECVVAQRLARRLCLACRREIVVPTAALAEAGYPAEDELACYEPVGCGRCAGTGYKGRIGLYEVMSISDDIRLAVLSREPIQTIEQLAVEQGMRRLRDDGLEKVRQGVTSLAEVARVSGA